MQQMAAIFVAGLALASASPVASRASLASIHSHYAADCWQKRSFGRIRAGSKRMPGAGMTPDALEPFEKVYKDGFMSIDCAKDLLFVKGDKFGDGKYNYELEGVSNVSIVHYTEIVAKEDRKQMTPELCFEFCRTVPMMGFFGITNGRDCYCMPFYKVVAGDSSDCDAVCDGDNTQMCGGKIKSSIFEMHQCQDTAENMDEAVKKASVAEGNLTIIVDKAVALSAEMQGSATTFQKSFGNAGDPVAADLMQSAKVFAGEVLHAAEDEDKIAKEIKALDTESETMAGADFTTLKETSKAEDITDKMKALTTSAEKGSETLEELVHVASPEFKNATDAGKQYYPIMYFVDKDFIDMPSTCGGKTVMKPIVNKTFDECAMACDAETHNCVGFSFFASKLCFLFSKFKSVTYYTACSEKTEKTEFLQKAREEPSLDEQVTCVAKLSEFDGTTLKPNPSGKCDICLREATKADRCFK